MQEIKKSRIVIASVLKPVNDTRMTEKLAGSLQHHYEVHIIGFPVSLTPMPTHTPRSHTVSPTPTPTPTHRSRPHTHTDSPTPRPRPRPHTVFHSLPFFKRLSLKRLFAPITILRRAVRLRPDIFIVTTHELLTTGLLTKMLTGCRLIYDIQENYWRNILYTPTFPKVLRPFIASVVRLQERVAMRFIDHCFLAEAGYRDEMSFLPEYVTVLENKIVRPQNQEQPPLRRQFPEGKPLRLLFTGTLAESTGVFTAIALTHVLHALDSTVHLTIIGYCAIPEQLNRLRSECAVDYIDLIGGNQLVPHPEIVAAVQASDIGVITYPPNPSTENSIPTKLYEYLGYHLPILLIDHPVWNRRCAPYDAAVIFDTLAPDTAQILHQIRTQTFYTTTPEGIYWDSEEEKLLPVIESVLNRHHK